LLLVQILFPESDELDAGIDYVFLDTGADPEKALVLLFRAKAYHVLDAGLRWRTKDNERERVPHSREANARAPSYGFRLGGGPEVLRYEDVSTPAPGTGELLIKMHAASVNPKTRDFTLHFRKVTSSSDFAIVRFSAAKTNSFGIFVSEGSAQSNSVISVVC